MTLKGVVDPRHASVFLVDDEANKLSFVPALFTAAGNGQTAVAFKRPGNSVYIVASSERDFADVADHWARPDILLLANKGIVQGVQDGLFAPDRRITRAEFASLLVRSLGMAEADGTGGFRDVRPDDWFAGAVAAAAKAGLVNGTEDGSFRPSDGITREQMAVMTAKALAFAGKPAAGGAPQAGETLAAFADGAAVSAWARDAVARTVQAGLMQGGSGGRLAPSEGATRAQAVVMLKRLLETLAFIDK